MDLVECLGFAGTLGEIPLSLGWGASVELIGSEGIPTLLPLSSTVGGVTLPIGVTGSCESTFLENKESEECEQNFPSEFHGCASACNSK